MTMRRMRIPIRGQSCLMCFDILASCQFSFHDLPHLRVIEVLYGHASNGKVADGSESSWAAIAGIAFPAAIAAGMSLQTSRLVNDMLISSKNFAGVFRSFGPSCQMKLLLTL